MINKFGHITNTFDHNSYKYLQNESMKRHTTFGIGGKVALLIFPKSLIELTEILSILEYYKVKIYFIGSGSNILITDNDMEYAIISLKKTFRFAEK